MDTIFNTVVFFPIVPFIIGLLILHNVKNAMLFTSLFISLNLYALLQYLIPADNAFKIIVSLHIILIIVIIFKYRNKKRFGIETIIKKIMMSITVIGTVLHFVLLGACFYVYLAN